MGTRLQIPITAIAACCGLLCACAAAPSPTPTPVPTPSVTASPSLTPTIALTPTPVVFDIALPDIAQTPAVDKPLVVVPWGSGKCEVGIAGPRTNFRPRHASSSSLGPTFGPSVMDVSTDGTIALVDMAHDRLLFIEPAAGSCEPFTPAGKGIIDVDFDKEGRLAVFVGTYTGVDWSGKTITPYLLVYSKDRQLDLAAPVYTEVIDNFYQGWGIRQTSGTVLYPLDENGKSRSREEQRASQRLLDLQTLDTDGAYMQLVDRPQNRTFTIHDPSGTPGILLDFRRFGDIYIAVLRTVGAQPSDTIRVSRFNPQGYIIQDVHGPWRDQYGVMTTGGQVAVDGAGNVYILEDSEEGADIYEIRGS